MNTRLLNRLDQHQTTIGSAAQDLPVRAGSHVSGPAPSNAPVGSYVDAEARTGYVAKDPASRRVGSYVDAEARTGYVAKDPASRRVGSYVDAEAR